jgi:hypothetical protein
VDGTRMRNEKKGKKSFKKWEDNENQETRSRLKMKKKRKETTKK